MVEIELTQDQTTIIDDIDSDLASLNWYASWDKTIQNFYVRRSIRKGLKQTTQYMHYIILSRMLERELSRLERVDHINRDTLDNRRENLRLATHSQNAINRGKHRDNTSGYKGVSWFKRDQKWKAQIVTNRKHTYLGLFDNPIDAALAYDQAAKELHGEFANLNFED